MAKELSIGLVLLVGVLEAIILGEIYAYTSHHVRMEFEQKVDYHKGKSDPGFVGD